MFVALGSFLNSHMCSFTAQRTEVLTEDNIVLFALVTEFVSAVRPYIHKYDNAAGSRGSGTPSVVCQAGSVSRIVHASRFAEQLRSKLTQMFDYKSADGQPRDPLVLSDFFTTGYVQIVCNALHLGTCLSCHMQHT
jgi:hypothetical protein